MLNWLVFLNRDLNDTQSKLDSANKTIADKEKVIEKQNSYIKNLESNVKKEITAKEKAINDLQKICSYTPFAVTASGVSSSTFSFDYFCPEEREVELTLKAICTGKGQPITNSHTITLSKGNGSCSLYFDRSLNSSYYYYVVLMYRGHIVAGRYW